MAYATLSDPQKRTIYDRYGEEDPDNRGGGGAANMARHFRHGNAQEVSPEDIFNMFFGGGMPGGGAGGFRRAPGGFHVYTNGFGGGFGGGMPAGGGGFRAGGRRPGQQQRQQQQQEEPSGLGALIQLMPLILIMLLSFFNFNDSGGVGFAGGSARMPGMDKYFSLVVSLSAVCLTAMMFTRSTAMMCFICLFSLFILYQFIKSVQHKPPFTNPLATRLTSVKDIPFYVSDKFLRTYYRDRYQLAQVERMVERAYEEYLVEECTSQYKFKNQLEKEARMNRNDNKLQHRAEQFELSRCKEIEELFPKRGRVLKEQQNSQKKKQQRKKHSYR